MTRRGTVVIALAGLACIGLAVWLTADTVDDRRAATGVGNDGERNETLVVAGRQRPPSPPRPTLESTTPPDVQPAGHTTTAEDGTQVRTFDVVVTSEGKPLGGAQVYRDGIHDFVMLGTTNTAGRTTVRIPSTAHNIHVKAAGHVPVSQRMFWPRRTFRFDLLRAQHHVRVVLRHDAQPVEGVRVVVKPHLGIHQAGHTDMRGAVRFPLPDFGYFSVDFQSPLYEGKRRPQVFVDPAVAEQTVEIALQRRGDRHGLVMDRAGQPVVGARVRVDDVLAGHTDAEGAFTAPPGTWYAFDADGFEPLRIRFNRMGTPFRAHLGPPRPSKEELARQRAEHEAKLPRDSRILDADGKPAPHLRVTMYGRVVRSDAAGRFATASSGGYQISVHKDRWMLRVSGVGEPPATIQLPRDAMVRGRLVFPEGLEPAGVMIFPGPGSGPEIDGSIAANGRRISAWHPPFEVARDGTFEVRLAVGRYRFQAVPDPTSPYLSRRVDVQVAPGSEPVTIRLARAKTTRIRVLAPDGTPVPRALVSQTGRRHGNVDRVTDSEGWAAFWDHTGAASYSVTCRLGERSVTRGPGDHIVRFDAPVRIRLALSRVSIPDGTACQVTMRNMANGRTFSAGTGTVQGTTLETKVDNLVAGRRYEVDLAAEGFWSPWAELTYDAKRREASATVEIYRDDED